MLCLSGQPAAADETHCQSQQCSAAIQTEGIWLWARVQTLRAPEGDGSLKTELNQYDTRDRLIQTTDRNGRVLKYGYDAASNQISYTDSDGVVSTREFDKKNRLMKTVRATLGAILLAYTGADELKTITHPNGTETNRTYDQAGRLASITVSQGAVTVSQRVYTFDPNGNRLIQVEKNGGAEETSTYEYDTDNRLTKVIAPDQTETYTLDAAGNRKTEVVKNLSNVVLADKTYSYNTREQLRSVADGANTTTYLYDGNGNQTSVKVGAAAATLYTWGPRDQLAGLSTGEAFEYDSAGHRTAKTSGGNRTLYVWSGDQLMAETNTIGNSLSQYSRSGMMVLGEVRNGVAQHFDVDGFNSVMVTTLSDGTVPGRISYRAYGAVRSLTGNIDTPFRFNGYVSDGGDELSSPSRFYSVGTGRFTSMDPATPTQMNPMSWNAYVGMSANPMSVIDPDGKVGIFFDGTNNNGLKPQYGDKTNVWKLRATYQSGDGLYVTGVGTEFSDGAYYGGKISGDGFARRVEDGYSKLVAFYNSPENQTLRRENPKEWERVSQIDLFGFSRGAAEARAFANVLKERGIPDQSKPIYHRARGVNPYYGEFDVQTFVGYEKFADTSVRFMGIFDTVDGRGLQIEDPDSNQLRVDTGFVKQTTHIIAAHDYRPGFDATSALPYFGAEVPGITEFYSAGAHSDVGGSQPQYERQGEFSNDLRNDNLQDINLAVMRAMAQRAGVELSPSAGQDQFTVDPRLLSEKQLWLEQIHDSRKYWSTYKNPEVLRRIWRAGAGYGDPFETMDRRKRDIYFTNGSHKTFDSEQLEKLWRSQNGYDLVVKEDDEKPGAKK